MTARKATARIDAADDDVTISPFDPVKFLDSEAAILVHIETALAENDLGLLIDALGDAIRARGVATVARQAGVGRESLYKTLAPGAQPKFETVTKLLAALGLRLSLAPARPVAAKKKTTAPAKTGTTTRRRPQAAP